MSLFSILRSSLSHFDRSDHLVEILDKEMADLDSILWREILCAIVQHRGCLKLKYDWFKHNLGLSDVGLLDSHLLKKRLRDRYTIPHCEQLKTDKEYFLFDWTNEELIINWS
jgi:hypothetical protein